MASRISGNRELNYVAHLDISEAKKRAEELKNKYVQLAKLAASVPGSAAAMDVKPLSNYRQAQLQMQQALADSRAEVQRLRQEQEQLRLQTEQLRNAQQQAKTQTEQLKIAEQQLKNEFQQGRISQQQYNEAILKNKVEQSALNNSITQGKVDAQNYKTEIARLNLQQKQQTAATREARQAMKGVSGSYQEAQERLRQLGAQIKSVEGGFSSMGKVQQARIKEYRELNGRLQEFDRNMGNHQRNVGNYRSVLDGVGGSLKSLVAGYLSAAAVITTATATFTQSLKSDAVRTSLEFTFGSVDLADAKLKELLETSNRLGVNYNALTSSYKSFTGAVIASNFDFQEGERIFNAVAGASARLKLSADDTEGALRALQQMISKGNVQAEELRGQLGERIPGAFSIAARAMGVTESKLNDMLKAGDVLAVDLLPKLANELEKTFDTDSEEKVTGLSAAFQRLNNVFSGAVSSSSNISSFFESVINGVTRTADSIIGIVNSKSWDEFWARMFVNDDGQTGKNIRSINDAYDSAQKTIGKAFNFDAANAGSKELVANYEELRIAHEKASKALEVYKKGVADGSLTEKGKTNIKSLTQSVDLLYSKMTQAERLLPKMAAPDQKTGKTKAEIAAEKKAAREAESALKAQRSLQEKINEMIQQGLNKQLSADEQELQSVRNKYDEMRDEAIKFNNDPVNKKRGLRVDSGGLTQAQDTEITALRSKQAVNTLKEQLDAQKGMYEDYEFFKEKLGKTKADEMFSDRLKGTQTYLEKLQKMEEEILDPQQSKGADSGGQDLSAADKAKLKEIQDRIDKEKILEDRKIAELLERLRSYEEERLILQQSYAEERSKLTKESDKAALDAQEREAIAILDDANVQKLDAYKALYEGIDRLSDNAAKDVIAAAQEMLDGLVKAGKISKEFAKEIGLRIADTDDALKDRMPVRLKDIAQSLGAVASQVGEIDEGFGNMIGTLANVIGSITSIKSIMDGLAKAQKDGTGSLLGSISGGIGIAGAAIGIITGISKALTSVSQKEREQAKYTYDLQLKQTEAVTKALERQVAAIEEAFGTERLTKYNESLKSIGKSYDDMTKQIAGKYTLSGDAQIDKAIKMINEGGNPGSLFKEVVESMAKAGVITNLTGIADGIKDITQSAEGLDQLQQLLDLGKLDEQTAILVSNAIKQAQLYKDTLNALKAETTGTTFNEIADSIVSMFEKGTTAAEDFGNSFEEIMKRSILNSFKRDYLAKELQSFYDEFAEASKDTLTSQEIAILEARYQQIISNGKTKFEDLEKVAGVSFGQDKTPASLSSNRVTASLTEETASRTLAVWTGMHDINKRQLVELNSIKTTAADFYLIARDNFNVQLQIERNTANTVSELKSAVTELKAINKNTGGMSTRDMGR